ncbi:MAG: hypothetical protein FWF04_02975 [Clostridiales bacterium]|nr:hypothetical protein [Clostridiales bacterium]
MQQDTSKTYVRVCVDVATGEAGISGRVYNSQLSKPLMFNDIGGLLLRTEKLLESQNFPTAFQRKRSFLAGQESYSTLSADFEDEVMDAPEMLTRNGSVCTFIIHILARQNASWQGVLEWLDGQPRQVFKSELELVRLLSTELN